VARIKDASVAEVRAAADIVDVVSARTSLRRVSEAARRAGALGSKVCGAGGGGCLVAFAPPGRKEAVAAAMAAAGAVLLPVEPARRGVTLSAP